MTQKVLVHVLSLDPRVTAAARSLPAERFDLQISSARQEALDAIDPDVAIAVIDLELTGFAMAIDLREKYRSGVRVVMLIEREHDRWLAEQARSDVVIVKPLDDTDVLVDALETLLKDDPAA